MRRPPSDERRTDWLNALAAPRSAAAEARAARAKADAERAAKKAPAKKQQAKQQAAEDEDLGVGELLGGLVVVGGGLYGAACTDLQRGMQLGRDSRTQGRAISPVAGRPR